MNNNELKKEIKNLLKRHSNSKIIDNGKNQQRTVEIKIGDRITQIPVLDHISESGDTTLT